MPASPEKGSALSPSKEAYRKGDMGKEASKKVTASSLKAEPYTGPIWSTDTVIPEPPKKESPPAPKVEPYTGPIWATDTVTSSSATDGK
jgi:hypothetical protein